MPRRWVDLPLRAKSLVVIAIPMIPLLVSSVLFADSARRARLAQESVAHTLEVKAQIAIVLGSLVDAETGVRGVLLTHTDEAMRVYRNAMRIASWPSSSFRRRGRKRSGPTARRASSCRA